MSAGQAPEARSLNTIQAVNLALDEAMRTDPNVILLGEDIADEEDGGVVGVTKGLSSKYGKSRVRSTPISEQAIIGAAIGAAIVGMRPVAEIMLMNFTTVAMDMIVNHAAKLRFMSGGQTHVPITIRTMTGAGFGTGGQHADYLEAWFAHTAGIKVVAPSSPADAYGLMLSCIFDDDPCLFIENMPTYWTPGPAPQPASAFRSGKQTSCAAGSDVTVISYSRTVGDCMAVAEKLAAEGHPGRGRSICAPSRRSIWRPSSQSVAQDPARGDRARSGEAIRRGRGNRLAHQRGPVRPAGRAGAASRRLSLCRAILQEAGNRICTDPRAHRGRDPRYAEIVLKRTEGKQMSTQVLLPKIGFSMNEGVLARWLVADGAPVQAGQALYEMESDKSVQEVEAPASGTLRIIAAAGESYVVGAVLGEIVAG